jgi:hypothetical protein
MAPSGEPNLNKLVRLIRCNSAKELASLTIGFHLFGHFIRLEQSDSDTSAIPRDLRQSEGLPRKPE